LVHDIPTRGWALMPPPRFFPPKRKGHRRSQSFRRLIFRPKLAGECVLVAKLLVACDPAENGGPAGQPGSNAADVTVWPLWSGDARAVEWVKDCPDLYMCPCATASRADIALVELRGNGVVAGRTGPHEPSSTWHKSLTPRLHRKILTAT
jgi:hypothetical protein